MLGKNNRSNSGNMYFRVLQKNVNLKFIVVFQTLVILFFSMVTLSQIGKKAEFIVFDSAKGELLESATVEKSEKLKNALFSQFVKTSFDQRFSFEKKMNPSLFSSLNSFKNKAKEESELTKNKVNQYYILRDHVLKKGTLFIEADRIIRINGLASVVPVKISTRLQRTEKTIQNPFGLVVHEFKNLKK